MTIRTLKDVREKLLCYTKDAAARLSHISIERLTRIEEGGESPTVFEAESLSRIYGIDADILADECVQLTPGDGVETLASLEEFRGLDDVSRMRVVAAANAARDLNWLRRLEQSNVDLRESFKKERPNFHVRKDAPPYRQGAQCASDLRKKRSIGGKPITSIRDFVAEQFPSIAVLYAELGGSGPAGLTFLDHLRGPTVILNLEGKNKNPCVRRFSLAHELCHLLLDWNMMAPIATISGYLNETRLELEQRANAFAVRLICPEKIIKSLVAKDRLVSEKTVKALASFGLPYRALRLYLRNEGGVEPPDVPFWELGAPGIEPHWLSAEEPIGIKGFPLEEVKPERRTIIAQVAARLYSTGRLRRDAFADALGVTPAADLEIVLDFFALNLPREDSSVTAA